MDSTRIQRRGARALIFRRTALALTLVAVTTLGAPARGGRAALRVGMIVAAVEEPGVEERVRSLVVAELGQLELPATRRSYLLDVSLDELSTRRSGELTVTRCRVSATLRDADDGALRAILRGSARTDERVPRAQQAQAAALSAAVRSALKRVPEAVR
jgi:hypothetical protein